ncbi:ABC-F family ATP-binding cassette domain-containing protein [candidate division KSB1 bacterium]
MKLVIQLNSISKRYASAILFDNVSVGIAADAKVGIIGRNGAGKTTLFKLITGEEKPDSGTIDLHRDLRLSYLEQLDPFKYDETALEFLIRYTGCEEWQCGKVASQFNLSNELLSKVPVVQLPGGYQTRVKLTAMLLSEPNFLLLDEPTNYLDLSTLILLEHFLKDYSGAFLIVSHDRQFLKNTCSQTLEVENGQLTLFPGNIEEYLEYKDEILEIRTRHNINVEQKQKKLQEFIDRFKAKNTKARQAQSKKKQLKRLKPLEIEFPVKTVRIRMPQVELKKKGWSLICRDLSIGYPEINVASSINLEVRKGSHAAVLGNNGQGKTTFLRTIAGELTPKESGFQWAKGENTAYYAQHISQELHPDDTIVSYLERKAAPGIVRQDIMNMAGSFLFHGDDILKTAGILSGGEKARVCLMGLLLSGKPVLLFDEPTNHLDFETVEALGKALGEYNGTILFVSHDRTFVSMLATDVIDVKNGRIEHFPGTYEDYVYHIERQEAIELDRTADQRQRPEKTRSVKQVRKALQANINKLKKETALCESKLVEFEKEKVAIINVFSLDPASYSAGQNRRLDELTALIEQEEHTWLELQEAIEKLRARIE